MIGSQVFRAEREEDRLVMNVLLGMMQRMGFPDQQFSQSYYAFDFSA